MTPQNAKKSQTQWELSKDDKSRYILIEQIDQRCIFMVQIGIKLEFVLFVDKSREISDINWKDFYHRKG